MSLMEPPASGFKVRMYRHGHGDCFLLAARKDGAGTFYMVIDCGIWSGSEFGKNTLEQVIADIGVATNNHVNLVLITHEHEDHVSGFTQKAAATNTACWDPITVDELWLAWTENGEDEDANALRKRFKDVLFGLLGAVRLHGAMGISSNDARLETIKDLLALDTGDRNVDRLASTASKIAMEGPGLAAAIPGESNKRAMQYMRRKAGDRVTFLSPEGGPYSLEGIEGVRVFALGPPRDPKLLLSLNPHSNEEFKFGLDAPAAGLLRALQSSPTGARSMNPFRPRFGVRVKDLRRRKRGLAEFFGTHHGFEGRKEGGPEWRRIDGDWLDAAEALALRLNDEVNNTSLVIAIELPATRKVLIFSGDAQRGSWISWSDLEWAPGGAKVMARELLSRAVFYKVGHHGSHNATLNGAPKDSFANLGWFAMGDAGKEFTAMIPAHKKWAFAKKPHAWKHPLKAIETELLRKAQGRVFRTDDEGVPPRPTNVPAKEWKRFTERTTATPLYFEYEIPDAW